MLCDCIDCQVSNTVKAQKSMKDIIKIVHLPSVVQSEFYEATRILFVCKENENNDLFNNLHHRSAILESIRWMQTAHCSVSAATHGYMLNK